MGEERIDAILVLGWRKLVLSLVVFFVNFIHFAYAYGPELRPPWDLVVQRQIINCINKPK